MLVLHINILKCVFTFMTSFIVILGVLINTVENHLPSFVTQTFRYGKFSYQGKTTFIKIFEVPKRWFRHFYVFAAVYTTFATILVFNRYFCEGKQNNWLLYMLDLLASSERKATVSATSAFLALLLLSIQSWHRFYETWFISVYSNARMNISHYFIGYIHYFGSVAAILAESPGFISATEIVSQLHVRDFTFKHLLGTTMFIWACYEQYRTGVILADLRKNHQGQVVNFKHVIPYGRWFELVSSPHLFMEIWMYLSLMYILWGSSIWPLVSLWVFVNQVESALLTHWWYKSTFKNYPPLRKAVIPYVL